MAKGLLPRALFLAFAALAFTACDSALPPLLLDGQITDADSAPSPEASTDMVPKDDLASDQGDGPSLDLGVEDDAMGIDLNADADAETSADATATVEASVDATTEASADTNALPPCTKLFFEGSTYLFCRPPRSRSDAETYCQGRGYHLTSIANRAENDWITNNAKLTTVLSSAGAWIGYNDITTEGQWSWPNGKTTAYENWTPGEPNNINNEDCAEIFTNGKWNDTSCTKTKPFICERESSCKHVFRDGHRYLFCDGDATWSDAQGICQSRGFELATVDDTNENAWLAGEITSLWTSAASAWIGYNDIATEGDWVWTHASSASFERWGTNEPNNMSNEDCATLQSNTFWNDAKCDRASPFICEKEPSCATRTRGGHSYLLCEDRMSWSEASTYCATRGHTLTAIESLDESQWINKQALDLGWLTNDGLWIGYSDSAQEGSWVWENGSTSTYENWANLEPNGHSNENCGMTWKNGQWNDAPCAIAKSFVCEQGCNNPVRDTTSGHFYWYCPFSATKSDAAAHCAKSGGHLATFEAPSEESFANKLLGNAGTWIGATLKKIFLTKLWYWDTGAPVSVTNWHAGEPNNLASEKCIEIVPNWNKEWNNANCSLKKPFLCEQDQICGEKVLNPDTGKSYSYCSGALSWANAKAQCAALGGHLARPMNNLDNDFIASFIYANDAMYVWLGGTDSAQEGTWRWDDGSAMSWKHWQPSQPDNAKSDENCLTMTAAQTSWNWTAGKWNDGSCANTLPSICEFSDPLSKLVTRRYILFAHGIGANKGEFNTFTAFAERFGFEVYRMSLSDPADDMDGIPDNNKCGSLPDRAREVAQFINSLSIPNHDLKAVGHSMGGLDLRWIVSKGASGEEPFFTAAKKISSVYTIATPHGGQATAELASLVSKDIHNFVACQGTIGMHWLSDAVVGQFSAQYPYSTFKSEGVQIPFLAYPFECPSCGGASDCVVGTTNQSWSGAPHAPTIHGAKHSGDLPVWLGFGCRAEKDYDWDVAFPIMIDYFTYPKAPQAGMPIMLYNAASHFCVDGDHQYRCSDPSFVHVRLEQNYRLEAVDGTYFRLRSLAHPSNCLAVANASTADDAAVIERSCSTTYTSQQWRFDDRGDGYYRVVARHSGKCLDIMSYNESATLMQHTCNTGANQRWRTIKPRDKWVKMRSRLTSGSNARYIEISGNSMVNGETAQLWKFIGQETASLIITASKTVKGSYVIRFMHDERCLDLPKANTRVQQWDCVTGTKNQQIDIIPVGNGYYQLKGHESGRCVATSGTNDGDDLVQVPCNSGTKTHWFITQL